MYLSDSLFYKKWHFFLTPTLVRQYYYPVGNTAGRYLLGT